MNGDSPPQRPGPEGSSLLSTVGDSRICQGENWSPDTNSAWRKNDGRNKIDVQFSSAEAANNFLKNPVRSVFKYVAIIPTINITRMGLVKRVPVDLDGNG